MEQKSEFEREQGFSSGEGLRAKGIYSVDHARGLLRSDLRERRTRLAEVINNEIIPRLRLIHHNDEIPESARPFSLDEVSEFGVLAIGAEAAAPIAYFEKLRAKGHSIESLFVNLLAPDRSTSGRTLG